MTELFARAAAMVAALRAEFAPDPRLAVFDVSVVDRGGVLALVGACSDPAVVDELRRRVAMMGYDVEIDDEVARLPEPDAEGRSHGIVSAPVAPMLSAPMIASVQVSQLVLGNRVIVLRRAGRWTQCRSADGYIGWVHRGYLHQAAEAEARAWEVGADGVVHLSLGAAVVDDDDDVVAQLPWGARVALRDGVATLPDGRAGVVRGELVAAHERAERFVADGEAVIATARRWLGAPYLWGGVTPAGVDCSGLVQAVMRLHGCELPRDADQQVREGERVTPGADFERLRPGDLLFFAEQLGRVTHVAISAGGPRLVHSSLGNGGVRFNDLTGALPYERELRELFVGARRVLLPAG